MIYRDKSLTLDEALSEIVLGYKITSDSIQDGAYIDYNFNGWRINYPSGSSSGWLPREYHEKAAWRVLDPDPVNEGWGDWTRPMEPGPVKLEPPAIKPLDSVAAGWAAFDELKAKGKAK